MATAVAEPTTETFPHIRTLADLIRGFGGISLGRVRFHPFPGTATVDDVAANRFCELVDGTLVEKAVGARESMLGGAVLAFLRAVVNPQNLGIVLGADGTLQILTGLVRLPDVAFLSWDRLPGRRIPEEPVPAVVPDIVVEVLSRGNTPAEMARKRQEYFTAGVRLVWEIDPVARTVAVFTSPTQFTTLTAAEHLDGGAVLPGFAVPLADLFAELDRHG